MDVWKSVAIGTATLVAVLVAMQPLYVIGLTLYDYGETPSESYTTMQTKDVTRFPADDPQRQSELTEQAARPPGSGLNYSTIVRVSENDWQSAVAASRLRASEDVSNINVMGCGGRQSGEYANLLSNYCARCSGEEKRGLIRRLTR